MMHVAIEMMLRVCLHQIMNIHERQVTTEGSVMLRQVHQRIFQEMVSDDLKVNHLHCNHCPSIHRHLMCYLRLGLICGIDII